MNSVSTATKSWAVIRETRAARSSVDRDQRMNFHVSRAIATSARLDKGSGEGEAAARNFAPANSHFLSEPHFMHAYRTHTCADLRASDVGSTVRLSGWIHRKRDHGGVLFVDLRDHYGLTQIVAAAGSEALKMLDGLRVESVVTITGEVVAREGGAVNPKLATGEIEVVASEVDGPVGGRRAADAGRRRGRLSRGNPPPIPLPRPAPRAAARQHHAALEGHRLDPPADDRPGLHRVPDADPDRVEPRRRARLSGAEPGPSGQILRAPAGAADVQAAADGRRLRPLFPDRALLPRRGCPRRPLARANSTSSISR